LKRMQIEFRRGKRDGCSRAVFTFGGTRGNAVFDCSVPTGRAYRADSESIQGYGARSLREPCGD